MFTDQLQTPGCEEVNVTHWELGAGAAALVIGLAYPDGIPSDTDPSTFPEFVQKAYNTARQAGKDALAGFEAELAVRVKPSERIA